VKIRPYWKSDFDYIKEWDDNDKTHAKWCANLLQYPLIFHEFQKYIDDEEKKWNQCAFTVTRENGIPMGFFCLGFKFERRSLSNIESMSAEDALEVKADKGCNYDNNSGFLKFVILDNKERGKGFGKEMLHKIIEYSFASANLSSVRLVVFDNNRSAIKTYIDAGFYETEHIPDAFHYKDELWGRCFMNITRNK